MSSAGVCLLLLLAFSEATLVIDVPQLGRLKGAASSHDDRVVVFNRIPYAEAPVGPLRWLPPKPAGPWKENPRDAVKLGAACHSTRPQSWANVSESEDCLFLNIAAVPATGNRLLPVMVFIHGGAFAAGASNYNRPDSLVVASNRSVVVVTLNYRLNALGFLGTRVLAERSKTGGTGNWGMEDQRMALAWVQQHIAAFGGDRNAVTIFGESAGGESVVSHLVQPSSFKLYHRAIIESGCDDPFVHLNTSSGPMDYPTAEATLSPPPLP